jgi:hypothetical protein
MVVELPLKSALPLVRVTAPGEHDYCSVAVAKQSALRIAEPECLCLSTDMPRF